MPELPERKPPEAERGYVVELKEPYPEKEGLVERVWKEDLELEKPVTYKRQVLVTSARAQKPRIVLPITRQTYLNPANWHKPIVYAIRWLLTWAQRIIKMQPKEVVFEKT
ncbi:hypothetical protein COU95_03325 [Candidatus Shapirobacteria bacterium CG10_big_fil_rev_8_21_14_0_10_40_9]|uniref:Uncharacterized protein n=1 Tax=Candidatus Shapirobacteria bacterium CG10_big_fil_rev_8_21_14_0_10_40_9 TaxID=1974888 RepID=A0A2M8L2X1_9BACT|nr:MAG: hypothetical protein COU95_03325 [Candidatus Shapirobacteria bacterium CG10_big_fil_rev_8_21_14_0_10_40_9]